ncbi:MAG: glycosyltransferase, partial [Candidatus Thorarchaeota archaeon]
MLEPRPFYRIFSSSFIDDGSNDNSAEVASFEATKHGIPFKVISMPKKPRGNLDTLGRAWNRAQPVIKEESSEVQYVAMTDVDTLFSEDYFKKLTDYMDRNPHVGVVAGQVAGQPRRTFPMFTGKVVRTDIIHEIDKYWDISVDS